MSGSRDDRRQWTVVDQYLAALFLPADAALVAALEASRTAGLPAISVTPLQGRLLMLLASACQARKILEIGTLGGYSTIWLARGLPPDGRLITIESEPSHFSIAVSNITHAGLADRVDLRCGSALDVLAQLDADSAGPFDLIFIDADKRQYAEFFAAALPLAHRGTLIIADNVVREGGVADPGNTDESVEGIRRFFAAVVHEPRVSATVLQTVGEKGHDGWAVMMVTSDEGRPPGRA
jgi:predicted O-methyltransferase YrrM